jgi:pSer/pThr/pTyr-binding forkhead associated (FHA) protein
MSARLLRRSTATIAAELPPAPSFRIGSAGDAEVRVEAPGVRPVHATITREGDRLLIAPESADAAASVWLNGRRVSREPLQHLDVITLAPGVDLIYLAT